jgi:Tfp pilus assembly protein PilN
MSRVFNFAKRPFQDDRPVYVAAVALLLLGAALLLANLRIFTEYRREVADTRAEIAALEDRQLRADKKTDASKSAVSAYKLSTLAEESRGLAKIVAERRFSWTALLARLERTLPNEVGLAHLQPRFEADGEVWLDMQFYARQREAVVKTIAALGKDTAFEGVELRSENATEPGSPEPFHFSLGARYEPPASTKKGPAEPPRGVQKGTRR